MKKTRVLTAQEKALWAFVAKSAHPIRRGTIQAEMSMKELMAKAETMTVPMDAVEPSAIETKACPAVLYAPLAKRLTAYPALAPIERNLKRKLSKGKAEIDGKLDLHGLNQEEAYNTLTAFIHRAVLNHKSLVLIVTGKGGRKPAQDETYKTGVLRRMVPIWLSDPALRGMVIGFEEAAIGHGGAGALYLRLRRTR